MTIDECEALDFEFPNEYVSSLEEEAEGLGEVWHMYCDDVVNLSSNGISAVLVSPYGKHYPITVKLRCKCTNNVHEYKAYAMAYKLPLN